MDRVTYTDEEVDKVFERAEDCMNQIAVEVADLYRWVFALTAVLAALLVGLLIVGIVRGPL